MGTASVTVRGVLIWREVGFRAWNWRLAKLSDLNAKSRTIQYTMCYLFFLSSGRWKKRNIYVAPKLINTTYVVTESERNQILKPG